jgi:mRNA interferase RelE/StbE
MTWTIEFTTLGRKDLSKLTRQNQQRIVSFLNDRVAPLDDPRKLGAALTGPLAGHWKYRVGDYRVIARIADRTVTIVVVRIGDRKEIYR